MEPVESHPDVTSASRSAQADDPSTRTREWLLQTSSGTLCTTAAHREVEGYAFGSVVPFALDDLGRPFVLVARIAAHTANLRRDPRASLFVQQPDVVGDPQAGWRVTVMGTFAPVAADAPELPRLQARYAERVPATEGYLRTHDFAFWRMDEIRKVRYIAGFGKICWFDGANLLAAPDPALAAAAPRAIAHMNEDHAHNLVEMCRGLYGIEPRSVEMTGLARDGFFVQTEDPHRTLFFPFLADIDAGSVRHAIIDVLKRARRASSTSPSLPEQP